MKFRTQNIIQGGRKKKREVVSYGPDANSHGPGRARNTLRVSFILVPEKRAKRFVEGTSRGRVSEMVMAVERDGDSRRQQSERDSKRGLLAPRLWLHGICLRTSKRESAGWARGSRFSSDANTPDLSWDQVERARKLVRVSVRERETKIETGKRGPTRERKPSRVKRAP